MIEGLDPEEARAIIDPALQLMMDAVHQYDGYVAQALGDGIFALFGAPLAHEDHPQRALYAALRMQEAMRRYADTVRAKGYPPLQMRVGINTGEVVLRSIRKDDLHADYVPVGHSTNLAARMEQLANPGAIVVSAYTHRLTEGYFAFKDLGPTQIKGMEEALTIYEVLGAGPLRTRLQVSARRGLTRFVGRQSEMGQLHRALEQAKAGHGQIVGTIGEPGLGKSRLFYEFKLLSVTGCLVLEAYSVSHGKATAYLPIIELLKSYFDIQAQDDERKRREKVIGKVLGLARSLEDTLPYLFALLGIEEQPSPLQQMDPQIRRKRTFEALKKLFLRESLNQPLILIFEDLHWIDSETQGFLDILSEGIASAKILLLVNYRPEYRHEWGQKTYYTQLRLSPFGKAEAEEFLDALLGASVGADRRVGPQAAGAHIGAPLQHLKQLILDKTEGTPFFMEEIVQDLFEQGVLGARCCRGRACPAHGGRSKQRPYGASYPHYCPRRLRRPHRPSAPEEKALLQQLSVIGREFSLSLLRRVISQPEEELYHLLSVLQHKEFLYEQPAFPEVEYLFKHALTHEVSYNSVLQERRKTLHEQTARVMEELYSATLEDHYSELAYHYSRSGNTQKAIEYLHKAGRQAVQRSAYKEAVSLLTTALDLLKMLADASERAHHELALQLTLVTPLQISLGLGSSEVGNVLSRAQELGQQLGETSQLFQVSLGLRIFHLVRGEWQKACKLGEQCLRVARETKDQAFLLGAHHALGDTVYFLGELISARAHQKQTIALYDPSRHQAQLFGQGYDLGMDARAHGAWVLWYLGYPDQALKMSQESLMLAQGLNDPYNLAHALWCVAWLHQLRREGHTVYERTEAMMNLATEHGFSHELMVGLVLQGWALAEGGRQTEGLTQLRQGLATAEEAKVLQPWGLLLLAEAYRKARQRKEGRQTVEEALAIAQKTGECLHIAELYRLKGELTLQKEFKVQGSKFQVAEPRPLTPDPQGEAEACFRKAIDTARQQQAKSWELRAGPSLARLWQQQGKKAEAHKLLSDVYNWFTEGFETKDLQEARALIEELSR